MLAFWSLMNERRQVQRLKRQVEALQLEWALASAQAAAWKYIAGQAISELRQMPTGPGDKTVDLLFAEWRADAELIANQVMEMSGYEPEGALASG